MAELAGEAGRQVGQTEATVAMKSGGYYSERTRGAKDVIDKARAMLLDAVAALPEPEDGRVLRLADFGAADGGTSKETIHAVIAALRTRFPAHQVQMTYTDLPSNDFSNLFKNMLGLTGSGHDYLTEIEGVFLDAVGIGFHQQLLPDVSLDIGFSATAMHYVSEKPCDIPDHVHMVGASGDVLAAFAARAADDWEKILLARARELRPGGRIVICNFGIDEEGRYLGATGGVNMFDTFDRLWKAMVDDGRITHEEYVAATFAQFYRTKAEFCAPLEADGGAVVQAGLRLISAETRLTRCPYRAAFKAADGAMSTREFAISYIPTLRSWSETVFATALDASRPADERATLVDAFYQAYEDEVAAAPDGHAMDYVHCFLEIEKVGR
ncbi:MAG: SAM-dependent methyltransferase [Pseudomonadota bacterium]